jgi:hypothetical protein
MTEISSASPLPEPEINAEELLRSLGEKPASSYRKQAILLKEFLRKLGSSQFSKIRSS